jgi:hypothetical protein
LIRLITEDLQEDDVMSANRKTAIKKKLAASRAETLNLAHSLTEAQWNAMAFDEGSEWRVVDILRHVADSERGMTNLIVQICAGGEGVPPDFDLGRWNQRAVQKLQDKTPQQILSDMADNRLKLMDVIDTLADEDWDKRGRHASLQIMSVEEVLSLIADHERSHFAAVRETLA